MFSGYGFFSGEVVEVDCAGRESLYTVRYSDGDVEVVTRPEVIALLQPRSPCVFSSVRFQGSGGRVLPAFFLKKLAFLELWAKIESQGWKLEYLSISRYASSQQCRRTWCFFPPNVTKVQETTHTTAVRRIPTETHPNQPRHYF